MKDTTTRMITSHGIDFTVEYVDDGDDFIDFEVFMEVKNTTKIEWVNATEVINAELLEELRTTAWEERGEK